MKRILYLDAAAGISGDMFLGALTDLAEALDENFSLVKLIETIGFSGYVLSVKRQRRSGISGIKADVQTREHHPCRNLSHIIEILDSGDLTLKVREKASFAFKMLAEAEAKVHGTTPEEIHFHEMGAVDSIIDITGAMLLMERLGWPDVMSSAVNVGSGTVECSHGILPVPTPATAELLRGMKIFSSGDPIERTTPTGALLLRVLVGKDGFRNMPKGTVICTGTGLGSKDTHDIPNIIRATLLDADGGGEPCRGFERDETFVIESNIDDMNPQDFSAVTEKLLASGALDVWRENILMKKNRQAVKLCCLCHEEDAERFAMIIIRETTTLGVRISRARRLFLSRSVEETETSLGAIRLKKASIDGQVIRQIPEYDDLLRLSKERNLPLPELRRVIDKEI